MQQHSAFIISFCLCLSMVPADAAEKIVIPATLRSVTVYRSGAELVHTATARLEQGNNEVIIGDLSNSIDQTSIRIGCSASVTIMSVTFSTDYLQPETTSPVDRKLLDSLASIRKELARVEILDKSDTELLDLLNSNKSIGGSASGVSVGDLSKMMDYYKQKTLELRTELESYAEKAQHLKEASDRLQDQITDEEKKNGKTGGRLVLQLLSPLAGPCDFTISYLTTAAHWDPLYDLKVNSITEPLHILYRARVAQTSGIDWKHVKLSLSTSRPSQGGNAPVLKTWFLQYVDPYVNQSEFKNALQGRVAGLEVKNNTALNEVVVVGYSASTVSGSAPVYTEPLYIVNGKEISVDEYNRIDRRAIKKIDELKGKEATALYGERGGPGVYLVTLKDELSDYVDVSDRQMDVVFDLDIPYDLPGNGKEQGVVLKEYQVACSYQYYSAPRLDKDAYLLGEMADWEKLSLLPGEANIIVEGTYVGKSYIDPNSTQDHLNLTLGRDKRIAIRKEKIADFSSVKFLGANKKEIFTYEITVRNNKKEKVSLLLKDQYPISSNKDIEEELLDGGGATVNKDTGILMWNVELAAGESKKFRISYSVKYPKDKILNIN
jgi:Domain of unknown function (DUF4139)/N-terminal domain of unknown function (DUF4140)